MTLNGGDLKRVPDGAPVEHDASPPGTRALPPARPLVPWRSRVWTHRTLVDLCVANMTARIVLNAVIVSYALDADSVYDVNYVSTDVLDNTYY